MLLVGLQLVEYEDLSQPAARRDLAQSGAVKCLAVQAEAAEVTFLGGARTGVVAGRLTMGDLGDTVEEEAREQLGAFEPVVEAKRLLGEAT